MASADAAGAEAFVRHYFALVNYAQATGDLEPLRAVSGAKCAACQGGTDWIDRAYRKGGRIDGGDFTVGAITRTKGTGDGSFVVSASLSATEQRVVNAAGKTTDSFDGSEDIKMTLRVRWSEGSWTVRHWERVR